MITVPISALKDAPGAAAKDAAKAAPGLRQHQARVLLADGSVQSRTVEVAVKSRHRVEVRSGLAVGEQLITGERAAQAGTRRFKL
ncbi:hypothetical protein D3C72_2248230 [compost metagenome]